MDPRLAAFLSSTSPEIFHSVEHRQEIWREDPFDVTSVHLEAREAFERLVYLATTPPGLPAGRILLLLGESGAGKTHLLRAFRNRVHESGDGFVSYMQMTTATPNYGRYLLVNLIDSLDQPYFPLLSDESGLGRLSKVLLARCQDEWIRRILVDDEGVDGEELVQVVRDLADGLVSDPRFADQDLDLIRALLFLQRRDPRLKARVLKYLRGEALGDADRQLLGGIVPRSHDEDPQRLVEAIGRLAWTLCGKSLVMCVDQLEDMYSVEDSEKSFRRAMAAICAVCDRVPSAIVVICCLEDFWEAMKPRLTRSTVDRIERDPDKLVLRSLLDPGEVTDIVGRRLEHLYDRLGIHHNLDEKTFPFPPTFLGRLAGMRTRDVLDECRRFREAATVACAIPESAPPSPAPVAVATDRTERSVTMPPAMALEQAWNDFYAGFDAPRPEAEEDIASLLAWALAATAEELGGGTSISARARDGFIDVERKGGEGAARILVAVCNRPARGGALGKQITQLMEQLGSMRPRPTPVLVRTDEFPANPKAEATRLIGALVAKGGRRTQLEDSDLLRMLALRAFLGDRALAGALGPWLETSRPLARLRSVREILDLGAPPPDDEAPTPVPVAVSTPAAAPSPASGLVAGETLGPTPRPVVLDTADFTRHAAFLGGSGSGKTTLVMGLVEQILLAGVPAIVVDHKGDLAGYLRDEAWTRPIADAALAARRDRLRAAIDPVLYTPGHSEGRPLAIDLAPAGMGELPEFERREEAFHAASALAGMLDYRNSAKHKAQRAILAQAFDLLTQTGARLDLDLLVRFIDSADPALVAAVGRLDTKHFRDLVSDLETLRQSGSKLFEPAPDRLDVASMFSPGSEGRTRLTIISTQFLGDTSATLYWVAQLLLAVIRWTTRHPAPRLQGAILLDEADLYLPANAQPATKAPLEGLLKRARTTGLGVLLASQNPGDLDYKCRDSITSWFIGRVKEPAALAKLKPMLQGARGDLAAHILAQKPREFVLLQDGAATELAAASSCVAPEQRPEAEILRLARRRS